MPEARPSPTLRVDPACVEVRGLLLGLRRAFRMRAPPGGVADFRSTIEALGLVVEVSDMSFWPLEGGRLRPGGGGQGGVHLLVVAGCVEVARACLRDELDNAARGEGDDPGAIAQSLAAHGRLGRAYGYPACCVQAFGDAWLEAMWRRQREVSDNALAILRAHRRTRAWHPWLRAFGGGVGEETGSVLRHLPCRFDCPASIALAGRLLDDLRSTNPEQHRICVEEPVVALTVDAAGRVRPAPRADIPAAAPRRPPASAAAGLAARFPLRLPFAPLVSGPHG